MASVSHAYWMKMKGRKKRVREKDKKKVALL
jgi:hypothetical protein